MQLVAYGAQDVYLTGNPQITFFKVVYRRHTNFSKECIEQTFSGATGPSKRVSATLARNGDLVQEVYLKCTSSTNDATDKTNMISWVECEIGGQKIDKQYLKWLDIYNNLFETNHDFRNAMTDRNNSECYVPLRFWFNRNPGLALPLIALQYHEVKINIQLGSTATSDATLLVNYLYLDTDERRRFAQVSHEYLIEQVQHTGDETLTNGKITLNFNHPVKCLAWSSTQTLSKAKLQLNGHDRAAEQSGDYYRLVQPYESGLGHSNVMGKGARTWGSISASTDHCTYLYSFALKPGEHQPSGTCNFSRIDNAVLQVTFSQEATVSVHAVNYNVLRVMSGMGGLAYSN
jgi:hypothetical protein